MCFYSVAKPHSNDYRHLIFLNKSLQIIWYGCTGRKAFHTLYIVYNHRRLNQYMFTFNPIGLKRAMKLLK